MEINAQIDFNDLRQDVLNGVERPAADYQIIVEKLTEGRNASKPKEKKEKTPEVNLNTLLDL